MQSSSASVRDTSAAKQPQQVFDVDQPACSHTVFAFSPNRDTLGGTAYLIVEKSGNVLVDCPAWNEVNQQFLDAQGGVKSLVLTHRGGIGKVREIQQAFDCDVVIQEQEAYLLPGIRCTAFQSAFNLSGDTRVIWTSGHSPGAACVYHEPCRVLFSGRHLVSDRTGNPIPLRTAKTFHWPRQLRHVQQLIDQFSPDTLQFICPGANIGLLRGKRSINNAYQKLIQFDFATAQTQQPIL